MKFIIKTFGFLVTLVVFVAAYWFLLEPADRNELYANTVTKVTGKSFDESFNSNDKNQNHLLTIDDVKAEVKPAMTMNDVKDVQELMDICAAY